MTRQTHQFSQTKTADIPRSSFDLSHGVKTTIEGGILYPILSLECLPGDTINCRASIFGRLATPIKPILDNIFLETFFFFVPYRQVWTNWVKFMGEQTNPGDSIDFSIPVISGGSGIAENSIYDYFGIPLGLVPSTVPFSSLPFRCYAAIYDFWFRDENLIPSLNVPVGDGPDNVSVFSLQRRRKRRDYITSGLPFAQKGPPVTIDLGGTALVLPGADPLNKPIFTDSTGTDLIGLGAVSGTGNVQWSSTPTVTEPIMEWSASTGLVADLGSAVGFSINDLRESFQIQKLLERDARGGTRYPEILRAHFQVSDPALLVHQRPVFLGGGHTRININPVEQTAPSNDGTGSEAETAQGNLAAYGTVSATGHGFTYSSTEHGHIIGLVNVRADLTYQQGLERYWSRQTRYDFYFPVLSHLGEQAVLNKEVFVSNDSDIDEGVFAYMPRYDEYRFKQSQITSIFRSAAAASLDVWHLAQDFATLPTLSKDFIEDNPPIDRVVAVPSEPDFLLDIYFKIRAARPLPLYATPGLIDHF